MERAIIMVQCTCRCVECLVLVPELWCIIIGKCSITGSPPLLVEHLRKYSIYVEQHGLAVNTVSL